MSSEDGVQERNRLKAILEVVESEKSYVKDLRTIIEVFYDPLLAQLKDERVDYLFGNVKEVERVNKELCTKLEKMVGQFSNEEKSVLFYVASTFIEMSSKLVCYDRYCKNYDRAIELYQTLMDEPDFAKAVEAQRTKWSMRVNGLLLSDFIIKPVQRICKYPLLFKALIGYTSESHSDMPLLKKAEALMNKAAMEVNRARQDQKSAQDLKEIDDAMEGYTGGSLVVAGRFLIKTGTMFKLSPQGAKQERSFFLFTDMILYAKKSKKTYEYKDHIDLSELTVVPSTDRSVTKGLSGSDVELCFGLMRQDAKKKKLYVIIAENAAEKKSWMDKLNEAIDTANRRKQTVSEDAVQQLESRIGRSATRQESSPGMSGRTFSLFGSGKSGKSPRSYSVTAADESEVSGSPASSGDEVVLNAVKAIRSQLADSNKLLAQAQALQAKLVEKVEVMQRMVALEASAREELEDRLKKLESGGVGVSKIANDEDEDVLVVSNDISPSPVVPVERKVKPLPNLQAKPPGASPPAPLARQWASTNDLEPGKIFDSGPTSTPSRSLPKTPPKTPAMPPTAAAPRPRPLPTAKTSTGISRAKAAQDLPPE